jgi:methionyl-tRNA formyltransferase
MKIIFLGTGEFAVPSLRALAADICLVVTQPDRPSGRGLKMHASAVKQAALELGLPVETPAKCSAPEFVDLLKGYDADFLLVAAYGQILSEKVLTSTKRGGINLHGSILPEYRGAAPIQRAIYEGKTETGVTLMQMDKGMDTGDMIAIEKLFIEPSETSCELQIKLAQLAAEMIRKWAPMISAGAYNRVPQNHEQATYAPKIKKEEAKLDLFSSSAQEYNRFRAFTPNPGAFLQTKFGNIKLSEIYPMNIESQPGKVVSVSPNLVIGFQVDAMELRTIQPEGKKRMSGRDFANGMHLKVGDSVLEQE